jgi:N-acetylneuraminic acid mutarotase
MLKRLSLLVFSVAAISVAFAINCASAHFVWVGSEKSGDETIGLLFFSEGPHEHDYHLPPPIAAAKLFARTADGKRTELKTETRETDKYTGLTMKLPEGEQPVAIETVCEYGVYAGSLLCYYSQHVLPTAEGKLPTYERSKELALDIIPEIKPGGISATVLWEGKPLAGEPVTFTDTTGEVSEELTDADGKVFFVAGKSGPIGLMANFTQKDSSGESNGKKYTGKANYATLTLDFKASGDAAKPADDKTTETNAADKKTATTAKEVSAPKRPQRPQMTFGPELGEAVSSFGGAVADGWLYVYSGHTGREHQHSRDNLSQSFARLELANPQQWEQLPMETPLQGLPLVAANGKLYRIGGLNAKNARKEKEDLHSVDEFACFDPATKTWTKLPSLPGARSSHDAAVLDGKIYVVGGWNLTGDREGDWQTDALVYNLGAEDSGDSAVGANGKWEKLPEPPFQRRAIAVAAWNNRIWVLGGMDDYREIKRDVFSYDPATKSWAQAKELPGDDMQGFGVSAWGMDSGLCVSGTDGVIYRLSEIDGDWQPAGKLSTPRFFHRLLPHGENSLVAVAGASMKEGHMKDIEQIDLK